MPINRGGEESARMLTIVKRLYASIVGKLPTGSPLKRGLVDAAFWQLEEVSYARLRDRGFAPNGIVDVGAYEGEWIRSVRKIFPLPPALSIEAREEQRGALDLTCSQISDVKFVIGLLGSEIKSEVEFQVHGCGSSLFTERSDALRTTKKMPMLTLDQVVMGDNRIKPPVFLKLDVQGGELEVLRGAEQTLSMSEIVQLEVALLDYNEGAPGSAEVIAFMNDKGFSIYDIAGFVRPNNVDLVQIDVLFARKDSPLRRKFFSYR